MAEAPAPMDEPLDPMALATTEHWRRAFSLVREQGELALDEAAKRGLDAVRQGDKEGTDYWRTVCFVLVEIRREQPYGDEVVN